MLVFFFFAKRRGGSDQIMVTLLVLLPRFPSECPVGNLGSIKVVTR